MRWPGSSRKHSSFCRIRKCWATCARRPRITIAGYRAWRRSRRNCGKLTGSKSPHGEERGTRVSNHETPCSAHPSRRGQEAAPQDEVLPSALLRVEQWHRRIHHHFDQADAVMRKAARQCGRKFGCLADAHCVATQAFRDPDKIDAGQIEAWHVAYLHHLAERAHRAIACIVD